jgi:predicted amidophosphoribosyltransferase
MVEEKRREVQGLCICCGEELEGAERCPVCHSAVPSLHCGGRADYQGL